MLTVLASGVAVIGTLLGSILTYIFQRRTLVKTLDAARADRRREERLDAFEKFVSKSMDLRRAAYDRWHQRRESVDGVEPRNIRQEAYNLKAEVRAAYFRLRLILEPASDDQLLDLAWNAIQSAENIARATTEEERQERGEHARSLLDTFISSASEQLRG